MDALVTLLVLILLTSVSVAFCLVAVAVHDLKIETRHLRWQALCLERRGQARNPQCAPSSLDVRATGVDASLAE